MRLVVITNSGCNVTVVRVHVKQLVPCMLYSVVCEQQSQEIYLPEHRVPENVDHNKLQYPTHLPFYLHMDTLKVVRSLSFGLELVEGFFFNMSTPTQITVNDPKFMITCAPSCSSEVMTAPMGAGC